MMVTNYPAAMVMAQIKYDLMMANKVRPIEVVIHMVKHPKSTTKVMKQAKARSIKRSGHKVKPGKGRK